MVEPFGTSFWMAWSVWSRVIKGLVLPYHCFDDGCKDGDWFGMELGDEWCEGRKRGDLRKVGLRLLGLG